MNKISIKIAFIAWYFIAIVFIISALTKSVDIFSFSTKISEYIDALGMSFPMQVYEVLSVLICGMELSIGLCMLYNIQRRITYWVGVLLLFAFTILLSVIAIKGGINDCGCFGTFWNLTPHESIVKNILILGISVLAYPWSKRKSEVNTWEIGACCLTVLSMCLIAVYNQPLIDSTHYFKGVPLVINEYNDTKSIDVEYLSGEEIPKTMVANSTIGVVRDLNIEAKEAINYLVEKMAPDTNDKFMILTSSSPKDCKWLNASNIVLGFVDGNTLSKLISTNIGILKLKDSIIVEKWQKDFLNLQDYYAEEKDTNLGIAVFPFLLCTIILIVILPFLKALKEYSLLKAYN